jgi:hypothetical protein
MYEVQKVTALPSDLHWKKEDNDLGAVEKLLSVVFRQSQIRFFLFFFLFNL